MLHEEKDYKLWNSQFSNLVQTYMLIGALDKNWKASDRQGSASALVLREIHCALLRPIENVKIIEGSKPPNSVTVILPPNEAEKANLWPDRVVNAIFRSPEPVSQETWVSAKALHTTKKTSA